MKRTASVASADGMFAPREACPRYEIEGPEEPAPASVQRTGDGRMASHLVNSTHTHIYRYDAQCRATSPALSTYSQPDMQRNPSSASMRTTGSGSSAGGARKTSKAKDLLRDYYGLSSSNNNSSGSSPVGASNEPGDQSGGPSKASGTLDLGACRRRHSPAYSVTSQQPLTRYRNLGTLARGLLPTRLRCNRTHTHPHTHTDSPNFAVPVYIQHLLTTSSLPQLLQMSVMLTSSIGELESERQALVYNHHHELIDASMTISRMKVRAESLDTTLEQLKAGLARCSELESGLANPSHRPAATTKEADARNRPTRGEGLERSAPDDEQQQAEEKVDASTTPSSPSAGTSLEQPDWDRILSTLLDLPTRMRFSSPDQALKLWGTYEPVLRKWKEAGVQGIDEVEGECREALNAAAGATESDVSSTGTTNRRRSGSTLTVRPT